MIINDVHQGIQKRRNRKRVGRGPGSGHGKTSSRGHKGFYSRSGASRRLSFEGGQMALSRRIAKRGFNNKQFAAVVAIVNVASLGDVFENGDTVDPARLEEKGLISGHWDVVKILGNGDLKKKLTVTAHRFSQAAEAKIAAAGGSTQVILG